MSGRMPDQAVRRVFGRHNVCPARLRGPGALVGQIRAPTLLMQGTVTTSRLGRPLLSMNIESCRSTNIENVGRDRPRGVVLSGGPRGAWGALRVVGRPIGRVGGGIEAL